MPQSIVLSDCCIRYDCPPVLQLSAAPLSYSISDSVWRVLCRDESEILLPPGSSFLVVDDAMEKDDASTTMTKTTQQRQSQGHRRTTLLRVVTLLHIGSWMDAQLFKQFPAVEQAKRQLAVAVQEQRGAQQLWQFLRTQVEVAAVAAGMAPTPEAVQEIISETPSEVIVRTGGEYYTVDMASGQVRAEIK